MKTPAFAPASPSSIQPSRAVLTAFGLLVGFVVLAHPSFAADAVAAAAPAVEAAGSQKTLYQRVAVAGPVFMGMLFFASVCMCWLTIDGILRTAPKKLAPPEVLAAVRQHLIEGDYPAASKAVANGDSIFAGVATAAFHKIGLGKDATDDAIYEEMERTRAVFNSRISYLSVIGVITPMIGLTGTVFGMIHAFDTLGSSGVGDPAKLSEAIGEVLVCTGGGLVVAIPAFAFYYVIRNRISGGFRHIQVKVNELFHHLPYAHLEGIRLEADAFIPGRPLTAPSAAATVPAAN